MNWSVLWIVSGVLSTSAFGRPGTTEAIIRSLESRMHGKAQQSEVIQFNQNQKMQFCLHARGWIIINDKMFDMLSHLASKSYWDKKDYAEIDIWITRGLGAPLREIFSSSRSPRLDDLDDYLKRSYHGKNANCPLPCSYAQYHDMVEGLSAEQVDRVNKACQPNCAYQRPIVSQHDTWRCQCTLEQDQKSCNHLTHEERYAEAAEQQRISKAKNPSVNNKQESLDNIVDILEKTPGLKDDQGFVKTVRELMTMAK